MKREFVNAFDKVYLTVEFTPADNWMYNNWKGVLTTDMVIEGCLGTLEVTRQTHCPHMLNDNRAVVGSWSGANDWIATVWLPQALVLGLKKHAHIVSPGIFGQASAAEMETRVGNELQMRIFKDIELAKAWLREA